MAPDKVLLVTGGGRGIGAATARLAAQGGWAVAVNYAANSLAADEVVRAIRASGGIEQRCGPPKYRDLLGYSLGEYDRREFRIEEWVYGPTNGMLSILTFQGNRLTRIETKRAD